ncbi:hypothetical protein [Chlorogloea sp. CCALA 695]|nr:hypothetical protein [Chlorogloea sp. CCALA 695]
MRSSVCTLIATQDEIVESVIKSSALWDEVKDKLHKEGFGAFGWTTTASL